MSYLGGKSKNAQHILDVINHPTFDGMDYVEPFVGYCHILRRVERKRSYDASDAHPLLVTLLAEVMRGTPLPRVTRAEYEALRAAPDGSLRAAVAAFAFSFNGKEWGGYVNEYRRRDGRVDDIPGSRFRYYETLRSNPTMRRATVRCRDYASETPSGALVYCDPPYAATTRYGRMTFDTAAFWETVRRWSVDNFVFVSEYAAPDDFLCVAESAKQSCVAGGHRQTSRVERLFLHRNRVDEFRRRVGGDA